MQTLEDIKATVAFEVDHFNSRYSADPYREGHLWYRPTTAERDGGILVTHEYPAAPGSVTDGEWTLVWGENIRNYDGKALAQKLTVLNVLQRLPVLALA